MTDMLIENVRALDPGHGVIASSVLLRNGKLAALDPEHRSVERVDRIDGGGRLLTPGLIDIHTHGIGYYAYEGGAEDLIAAAGLLVHHGTTCIVPTVVPDPQSPALAQRLAAIAAAAGSIENLCVPGLHLEGPFVAVAGAACRPAAGDVGLLEELLDACKGRVVAVAVAPEVPNIIPVIERLVEGCIAVFITHTQATCEQTERAIRAGARHATHFYDVFPAPESTDGGVRPAGAVETVLASPHCSVDFICDGVHVHPMAIRAAVAAKGYQNVILITDSSIGAGLPEGTYETPWGYRVRIKPGDGARNADPDHPKYGRLAGSALTMDAGINNLLRWLDLPQEQVWAMGTSNPARLLGLSAKGVLRRGADADLVLWDGTGGCMTPLRTWVGGREVWRKEN